MSQDATPPGWYQDPAGSGGLRWWDGTDWSEQVQMPASAPPAPPPTSTPPAAPATETELDLDDLPPPSEGEVADTSRSRRPLLIGVAILVPVLIAGAAAIIFTGGGSAAASEGRLPDLRNQPEIDWTLQTQEVFDDLIDDIGRLSEDETWLPSARDIRAEGDSHLVDFGFLLAWDLGGNQAVLQPFLHDIPGMLYGLDTRSGEISWSTERILAPGAERPGALICAPQDSSQMICLARAWDEQFDGIRASITVISTSDGSILHEEEVTRRDANPSLSQGEDPGSVLLVQSGEDATIVAALDDQGTPAWETSVAGGWEAYASVIHGLVFVTVFTAEGDVGEVIDLETGEIRSEFSQPGSRDDRSVSYRQWGDDLLLVERGRGDPARYTVSIVEEDGQERWWNVGEHPPMHAQRIEPGAPILINEDGRVVTAIDPDDGEELWNYRPRGDNVRARLVGGRDVVLMDDDEIVVLETSTGDVRWAQRHTVGSVSHPLYTADSLLYLVEDGFRIRAFDLDDGDDAWSWTAPDGPGNAALRSLGGRPVLFRTEVLHGLG